MFTLIPRLVLYYSKTYSHLGFRLLLNKNILFLFLCDSVSSFSTHFRPYPLYFGVRFLTDLGGLLPSLFLSKRRSRRPPLLRDYCVLESVGRKSWYSLIYRQPNSVGQTPLTNVVGILYLYRSRPYYLRPLNESLLGGCSG